LPLVLDYQLGVVGPIHLLVQVGQHVGGGEQSSAGGKRRQQGRGACDMCVWNHRKPPQLGCSYSQETTVFHGSYGEVGPRGTRSAHVGLVALAVSDMMFCIFYFCTLVVPLKVVSITHSYNVSK